MLPQMQLIEQLEKIARFELGRRRDLLWRREMRNRLPGAERGPLKNCRKKSGVPMIRADLRNPARIRDGHESGEIAVLGAERVAHPCAHARKSVESEAGTHLVFGRSVRVRF